jgi:hypothetical protein
MRSAEANREDRSRPLTGPVELRIHGVGGTTPEILLGHPHPVQVAGDDTAGFYRPPDSNSLEAYSWGGITSRSGSRAFWLLVLPFALTNAAGFMLEPGDSTRTRLARGLLRLLALTVTVLFVLWVGGLALDLIAYQCGALSTCTSRHWWLTFFENRLLQTHPSRRIAVAMLVPATVIWAMRRVTSFTSTRYEEAFAGEPVEERPEKGAVDPAGWANLSDRVFWHSARFGRQLTAAHISAATAALAGATAFAGWRIREEAGLPAQLDRWLIVAAAALGILSAIAVVYAGRGPVMILPKIGWVLVALVAAANLVRQASAGPPVDDLPGYSRAALIAGLVALILAIVLLIVLIGSGWGTVIPPVATTSVGVFAMGAFLAGSHVRLADWLGDRVAKPDQPKIVYALAYDWFALAAFSVLAAAAVAVLIAALWLRRQSQSVETLKHIASRYALAPLDDERRAWLARIARGEAVSRVVDESDRVLTVVLAVVLFGSLAFYGVRTFGSGSPFGPIPPIPPGWRALVPLATWVCSVLPLMGLAVMYGSFRNPGTRRRVGMIWEVATFWPRWFHPLAPPPYSARAVPELGIRLGRLARQGASPITLSGHSQGSVVAAAALARLPVSIRSGLRLLTHGSPIGRLYGRFFPAYFGPKFRSELLARVGGQWINLFRKTDPIGGSVDLDKVDRPCRDPETDHREPGDPLPPVKGHSFYSGTAAYETAIADLNPDDARRQTPDASQSS